jgi:hypothetical protein
MKMTTAEVADKYTILCLKQMAGLPVGDLHEYTKALENIDFTELFKINREMWDLEDRITQETNLEMIGIHYLALRDLTQQRVIAKNKIALQCGEHFEVKGY